MNDSDFAEIEKEALLDRCADILCFGALYKCQECSKGDMIFNKHGYSCNGMKDEWVMCGNVVEKPLRLKCTVPDDLKHHEFFATCELLVRDREVRPRSTTHRRTETELNNLVRNLRVGTPGKAVKVQLKEGSFVDPESKLADEAHVYNRGGVLWSSVLSLTDIQRNKNSYCKLQVLESDDDKVRSYWLFKSSGRIGTTIGTSSVVKFATAADACTEFIQLFEEQTGNEWNAKKDLKRVPGKFYPIEVDIMDDINQNTIMASKMSPAVEELMKLLFNVQNMKRALQEFQLDLDKMPLGKLSKKQLQEAYSTLYMLESYTRADNAQAQLVGLSNKFFTLVPHNFGLRTAPVLDTLAKIQEKSEMIDSLLDIEEAYSIMLNTRAKTDVNTFDAYYKQLNAEIQSIDRASEDFKLIEQYVNTGAAQKVDVLEVFRVNRQGEKKRYEPFSRFHNRMLLWHGSMVANFASIISNGFRMPQNGGGLMFGRGIYLADMFCKSLGYCRVPARNVGLIALNEVALGNMNELSQATNVTALPPNIHSVKGLGRSGPDPKGNHTRKDGVVIPLGKSIQLPVNPGRAAGLNYNEYIVYHEAQINIQFLVKFKLG